MSNEIAKAKKKLEELKYEYNTYSCLPDPLKLIILKNVKTKLELLSVLNKAKENKKEINCPNTPTIKKTLQVQIVPDII